MKRLTRCNYCLFKKIEAKVHKENPKHRVILRKASDMSGWLQPVHLDENGEIIEEMESWFAEVTDYCDC